MLKVTLTNQRTQESATLDLIKCGGALYDKMQEFEMDQALYSLRMGAVSYTHLTLQTMAVV